ncbi:TPA: TIGR03747 family integrating conjugative element membrane protein [Legionella pneumophila]|uniref:TIGR03747 family integrating conjugative element membrane protein n=1 Tax=Legionella pneumophila TaxID=446 RepID=UPI000485B3BF|nr:TIGR03747 family integrating conjugative element membrane protein [Legionella pneumophila]SNV20237.1 Fe2+/Zn2+ uptake regulation protein [Legionella pneumophila]HAT8692479.1 TIGR03747 family integrating conjugative element membrane protein [Legionella pneumophila]HAU1215326.1 TIGR03747 family integrating conjugative element membrane protein [Legionella pneumophila]
MAIKTQTQRKSKRFIMSLLLLVLLGWLILLGWVLSLWCFSGFETAFSSVTELSQKQTTAVADFNDIAIAEKVKSWLGTIPTQEVTHKVTQAQLLIKNELNNVLPEPTSELSDIAEDLIHISKQVWLLLSLTAQVMLIKLLILLAAIPLFMLAMTAGLIDGLNQRAIRTASLGRESSYVFHRLNYYFKYGLLMLLALWLAIPVSITPAFVFVPVSILLSVVVSVTASRFKKYL